jgi:ribosomal protein S27AE
MKYGVEDNNIEEEVTYAKRQAEELKTAAQYCPKCGVPTVLSEGCTHIVFVCGAHWSWVENNNRLRDY